ncbi:hypothetical protein EJ02DRAFT_497062, partial [Clathrospora elynae]
TSELHFHITHTECLSLFKSCIFVELDGEVNTLSSKSGGEVPISSVATRPGFEVTVEKFARHNWGRAREYIIGSRRGIGASMPTYPQDIDGDMVVKEWTDPADIANPLFFWNLNSVITTLTDTPFSAKQCLARSVFGSWWIPFQLFVLF